MEVLSEVPHANSFVPLAEHQSMTPASFHSGPPVLYYYSDRCKLLVLEDELQNASALSNMVRKISTIDNAPEEAAEDTNVTHLKQKTLEEIDIWVTSEKLFLYSQAYEIGISIPYPTISLHAIQSLPTLSATEPLSQGLYMQLVPSMPPPDVEEPPETVSLTIIPTASAPPLPLSTEEDEVTIEDKPEQTPVVALFTALSDCSNLHPDPEDPDDDDDEEEEEEGSRLMQAGLAFPGTSDGSLPPPMPGSGGWITAENMHEYMDEDENFIGDEDGEETGQQEGEELGPGAGTVRSHPEDTNGDANQDSKWQRTS